MAGPHAGGTCRIGIVGAGIRGSLFARALASHPDAEVVGLCDRDPEVAGRAGAELGLPAFEDHEALLAGGLDLDAVIVATPDFAHRDAAVDAAGAGLHLMIEKPLATTVEDAVAIRDAVAAAGVRCMVGFENRFNPRFVVAKRLIDAGELGELLSQTAHLHDTRYVPTTMLSWAARSSPAWFLMPHTLDLLLWLSGKTPATAYATGVRRQLVAQGIDTWDAVDASLTFTDGTTATLHSLWVLPESYPSVYDLRMELVGTGSALRVEAADHGLEHFGDRLTWPQWGAFESHGRLRGLPVDMVHAFADWVLGRANDVPQLDDGLRVTSVIAAIDESLACGAPVSLSSHPS